MMTYHVQFLLLVLAGWVNRQQQDVIDYLQEENRVLRAGLRGKRLRLSDDERRRLAVKAQALGREPLTPSCPKIQTNSRTRAPGRRRVHLSLSWRAQPSRAWQRPCVFGHDGKTRALALQAPTAESALQMIPSCAKTRTATNTDTKLLICSLFQKSRVLAQDAVTPPIQRTTPRPVRVPSGSLSPACPVGSRTYAECA